MTMETGETAANTPADAVPHLMCIDMTGSSDVGTDCSGRAATAMTPMCQARATTGPVRDAGQSLMTARVPAAEVTSSLPGTATIAVSVLTEEVAPLSAMITSTHCTGETAARACATSAMRMCCIAAGEIALRSCRGSTGAGQMPTLVRQTTGTTAGASETSCTAAMVTQVTAGMSRRERGLLHLLLMHSLAHPLVEAMTATTAEALDALAAPLRRAAEMVLLGRTEVMLLRRTELTSAPTAEVLSPTSTTKVAASEMVAATSTAKAAATTSETVTATSAEMASATSEVTTTAHRVAAATHRVASTTSVAASATSMTVTGWQVRTQTQNTSCCQGNRYPADPGMHVLFLFKYAPW